MRVLRVEWEDSLLTEGWRSANEAWDGNSFKPVKCVSYGWELECNDEFIIIACSRANAGKADEQFSGIIGIPRSSVDNVTVLET